MGFRIWVRHHGQYMDIALARSNLGMIHIREMGQGIGGSAEGGEMDVGSR